MGFDWLEGRATDERSPWGYARRLTSRLAHVRSALDLDTGGGDGDGELIAEAPALPLRMAVTESWPPHAHLSREVLGPRAVEVIQTEDAARPCPCVTTSSIW